MTNNDHSINTEEMNLNMTLTAVLNWAYDNDLVLYKNLDYIFEAFKCRTALSEEERTLARNFQIKSEEQAIFLLIHAISLADFQDALKFNWTFVINNYSTNKGHSTYGWKYSSSTPNPYSSLIPHIEERLALLKEKGLDDWHKSEDHKKYRHFRYWIDKFLTDDRFYSLRLFVQHTGNTRSFDTLHIGQKGDEAFEMILQYILDNNICPNPHREKLEIPDYVNPDNHNHRYVTSSGRFGGFNYLVYLTAEELKEIYKTKINKRKLNYLEKAYWGYINATSSDKETKFYLFLT